MTKRIAFVFVLLGLVISLRAVENFHALPDSEFVSLFDGKTLRGWQYVDKRQGYFATNGVLVCTKKGGFLFTTNEFSDFVLRLEFKLQPGGNNGVAIRSPLAVPKVPFSVNEIQILDDDAKQYAALDPAQYCGSLYKVFPAKRGATKPPGQWNEMEITAVGPKIQVVLNGTTIVDGNLDSYNDPELLKLHPVLKQSSGRIGLLGHRDYVEFRNIRIHEVPRLERH